MFQGILIAAILALPLFSIRHLMRERYKNQKTRPHR